MSMDVSAACTPVNTVSKDNLKVFLRNNVMNESLELVSDSENMEPDSPLGKPATSLQDIAKKLFHSPLSPNTQEYTTNKKQAEQTRLCRRKRKRYILHDSNEKIKKAFIQEFEREGRSPNTCAGTGKKVLVSLFHNKEYSMDFS